MIERPINREIDLEGSTPHLEFRAARGKDSAVED